MKTYCFKFVKIVGLNYLWTWLWKQLDWQEAGGFGSEHWVLKFYSAELLDHFIVCWGISAFFGEEGKKLYQNKSHKISVLFYYYSDIIWRWCQFILDCLN